MLNFSDINWISRPIIRRSIQYINTTFIHLKCFKCFKFSSFIRFSSLYPYIQKERPLLIRKEKKNIRKQKLSERKSKSSLNNTQFLLSSRKKKLYKKNLHLRKSKQQQLEKYRIFSLTIQIELKWSINVYSYTQIKDIKTHCILFLL